MLVETFHNSIGFDPDLMGSEPVSERLHAQRTMPIAHVANFAPAIPSLYPKAAPGGEY